MEFQKSLDYVVESLQALQSRGLSLRVPNESLSRLVRECVKTPPQRPTPSPAPATASTPAKRESAPQATPTRETPVPDAPMTKKTVAAPQPAPIPAPPRTDETSGDRPDRLAALQQALVNCQLCPHLARSRTQVVFGVGDPFAQIMFIGEAPGEDEDLRGEPFVGAAGQTLTKIIEAMGMKRDDVYIANVLKCRPDMPPGESGNRKPTPKEMDTCVGFLKQQIAIIQPRVLIALGLTAVDGLLKLGKTMGAVRGRWHQFEGIPLMPTFHPAYLLRNKQLSEKRKVWEDMLLVMEHLSLPISEKQRGFFLPKA